MTLALKNMTSSCNTMLMVHYKLAGFHTEGGGDAMGFPIPSTIPLKKILRNKNKSTKGYYFFSNTD